MTTILQRVYRWGRASVRMLGAVLSAACVCHAGAATAGTGRPAAAGDCTFSNVQATSWRQVTRLTNSTPIGAVLYQRQVSLMVSYKYVGAPGTYELVSAGHWNLGTIITDGLARTNVDGIALRWAGVDSDGEARTLVQNAYPAAVAKSEVVEVEGGSPSIGNVIMVYFLQDLVLTKAATSLPEGDIVVSDLLGTPSIALYAINLPKGTASLGTDVRLPELHIPSHHCKQSITYTGVGNLTIGGGGGIEVPKQCEVESNMIVPVNLGKASLGQFPSLHATSQPVDFNIALSRCAAAAKPTISFRDKAVQPNADKTLLQLSAPEGTAVARGFNIVMTNGLTGERIAYDEPDTAKQYPMKRIGDTAVMPLSAQYIRTGVDTELKAGYAGGAAEFTFTFP